MLRCLLFALLWGWVMIPVPALSAPLSLDEETMLREPDTDCTGPVLALDGLSSPLRLCAGSRSGDDPPEWLQSRIRQIRFMGATLPFQCELDLESGRRVPAHVPAMNEALRGAERALLKLLDQDYDSVLRPLADKANAEAVRKGRGSVALPARGDFRRLWRPVEVFAAFRVDEDGNLRSIFFMTWASREIVRPGEEHFQCDALCVRITDGVPDRVDF